MSKLFITPRHGYLGKTMDKLREQECKVTLVGWGYPPIFVEVERNAFQDIQDIVEEIDEEAKFEYHRADLIESSEITNILEQFSLAEIIKLCTALKINPDTLPGYAARDLPLMAAELTNRFTRTNKISELVEETYKVNPDLF